MTVAQLSIAVQRKNLSLTAEVGRRDISTKVINLISERGVLLPTFVPLFGVWKGCIFSIILAPFGLQINISKTKTESNHDMIKVLYRRTISKRLLTKEDNF